MSIQERVCDCQESVGCETEAAVDVSLPTCYTTGMNKVDRRKYGRLLARALPVVIETEEENERMLAEVAKLMRKGEENLSPEELALLDVMSTLIEQYEEKAYPIPDAPPHRVLKTLMENRGLRQKDLMHIFRSSGTISEVLSGKRAISKSQAKALGEFFHLPADVFI